jgi:hypothetical protein
MRNEMIERLKDTDFKRLTGVERETFAQMRQWPKWVSKALPHADKYSGWSEVSIPGLKANPDALAWGKILDTETLFWLEVESGHSSKNLILDKTSIPI